MECFFLLYDILLGKRRVEGTFACEDADISDNSVQGFCPTPKPNDQLNRLMLSIRTGALNLRFIGHHIQRYMCMCIFFPKSIGYMRLSKVSMTQKV